EGSLSESDRVATESPFEMRLGSTPIAVLMRTPGQELNLATGFCLTEGILLDPSELAGIERLDGDRYVIELAEGVTVDPEQFRRNTYTTSSCGVCGKASIDAIRIAARPLPAGPILDASNVVGLVAQLRDTQEIFDVTGGLHGAALVGADGTVLASAEDVGRHNATDKAIGALARQRWPLGEVVLVVSGRISFEIAQKAAVAGVPVVVGVSAASSLAVELAEELGLTLIGFVRGESFVVYSGGQRIRD
ncbi:MAG: formate dehydrogenase accessory sulfurtransferase FdhD, partial [Acidimicrobiia bacterium]